jgi:hypothetical protein
MARVCFDIGDNKRLALSVCVCTYTAGPASSVSNKLAGRLATEGPEEKGLIRGCRGSVGACK